LLGDERSNAHIVSLRNITVATYPSQPLYVIVDPDSVYSNRFSVHLNIASSAQGESKAIKTILSNTQMRELIEKLAILFPIPNIIYVI